MSGARDVCEGFLRRQTRDDHEHLRPWPRGVYRHAESRAFLLRPGGLVAPDVQPASAVESAGYRAGEHARKGRDESLFPLEPPELAGAHSVLQTDARFSDRQHLLGKL